MRTADSMTLPKIDDVEISAVHSGGPGGQNVNKVSTAVHLRFDIRSSSLPERAKSALLASRDSRITSNGIIIIKASRHRTFEKNRKDALDRLAALIRAVCARRKRRRPTKPTASSNEKRLKTKANRSRIKRLRMPATDSD